METLLNSVINLEDVAMTSLHGLERSRFLLRCSLLLLAKQARYKIYHILDKEYLVDRVHHEATTMPFKEIGPPPGIPVAKCQGPGVNESARLVITSLVNFIRYGPRPADWTNDLLVLIYDVTSLDSLEWTIYDFRKRNKYLRHNVERDPGLVAEHAGGCLSELTTTCRASSIVLACNGPVVGTVQEMGHYFSIMLTESSHLKSQESILERCFASIIKGGLRRDIPRLDYRSSETKVEKDHRLVGELLEALVSSNQMRTGGTVVFFPTYSRLLQFHETWHSLGLLERFSVPLVREDQERPELFRGGLNDLVAREKSILLCSMRCQQDEELAQVALGQARLVLVVGLPYPELDDIWDYRIDCNYEAWARGIERNGETDCLNGLDLHKLRALDLMNGMVKLCLRSEYRSEPCHFFFLDSSLWFERELLAKELGTVQVESKQEALERFLMSKWF